MSDVRYMTVSEILAEYDLSETEKAELSKFQVGLTGDETQLDRMVICMNQIDLLRVKISGIINKNPITIEQYEKQLDGLRDEVDKIKAMVRGLREYTEQAHPDDAALRNYIKDILK